MTKKNPTPVSKYPEKGTVVDTKALKKVYKKLSDEELVEWLSLEGLTYDPCPSSQPINRMRMCMAIRYYFFPEDKPVAKAKESKYKDLTNEMLIELVAEAGLEVKPTDNEKILRMRNIMVLKEAGLVE